MRCSTPKQSHHGENRGIESQPSDAERPIMSLGLASLLNKNDSVLLRTTPKAQMSESSTGSTSNQALEQMSLDNRQENLLPIPSMPSLALSKSKNLPGSRSFEQMMQENNEKVKVEAAVVPEPKRPELMTAGMTGQGLIQQLKSKSLSLYGLWGSASKSSSSSSELKASDVDKKVSYSRESTPENTERNDSGKGLGVLGAISKCARNKDL